jgi:hypothetical protein
MTADPSLLPRNPPGWYVVTDQGVVLSVRFDTQALGEAARVEFVEGLRRELLRAGKPSRFIGERVAAVQVRYGVLVGAWNGFHPLPHLRTDPGP